MIANEQQLRDIIEQSEFSYIVDQLIEWAKPSLRITTLPVDNVSEIPVGQSRFGGMPDLPNSFDWPQYDGRPLSFIVQINMAEIETVAPSFWENPLPKTGILYFFFYFDGETFFRDSNKRDSWRTIYLKNANAQNLERRSLRSHEIHELTLDSTRLIFSLELTLPPIDSAYLQPYWDEAPSDKILLSMEQVRQYSNLWGRLMALQRVLPDSLTTHRLWGYPDQIQNDMQLECCLAQHGIRYDDPNSFEVAKKQTEWELLLQVNSDKQLGTCWADCGAIYYWIHVDALRREIFDDTWLILQST